MFKILTGFTALVKAHAFIYLTLDIFLYIVIARFQSCDQIETVSANKAIIKFIFRKPIACFLVTVI